MSLLDQIKSGVVNRPPKLLIAGTAGVGKSTFASCFENAVFVEAENRTDHLDISRFQAKTWKDVLAVTKELLTSKYSTVVFDTVDAIELLIFEHIARLNGVQNHEEIGGGFSKYRSPLMAEWKKFISLVDQLAAAEKQVVLIAHTHIKTFMPPGSPPYDRWALKMDNKSADYLIENCDLVGFAHYQTFVQKGKGFEKAKATTTSKRLLDFTFHPQYPTKRGIECGDSCELNLKAYLECLAEKPN